MRAAIVAVLFGNFVEVGADHLEHFMRIGKDILKLSDGDQQGFVFIFDLLALKRGKAAQLHVQNGLRLDVGEIEAGDQVRLGNFGILRFTDGLDHRIEVSNCDQQTVQNMRAFFGFVEFEERAAGDDDLAVFKIVR